MARPARRRRGGGLRRVLAGGGCLGRRLLLALRDEARACGGLRATLEVRPSNAGALALYEGEGFAAAALRPRYYTDDGEDALILWPNQL